MLAKDEDIEVDDRDRERRVVMHACANKLHVFDKDPNGRFRVAYTKMKKTRSHVCALISLIKRPRLPNLASQLLYDFIKERKISIFRPVLELTSLFPNSMSCMPRMDDHHRTSNMTQPDRPIVICVGDSSEAHGGQDDLRNTGKAREHRQRCR